VIYQFLKNEHKAEASGA